MVKFVDERGFILDIPIEGCKHLALNMSNLNVTRGNHYHKDKNEIFWIVSGIAKFILEDIETKVQTIRIVRPMDNISVPKLVAHIVTVIGNEPLYMLQLADSPFNLSDTFKYDVVVKSLEL